MSPLPEEAPTAKAYGASSTSFYTTTEKRDSYESLSDVLVGHCQDEKLRVVITDMLDVCAEITKALRTALVTVEGSTNDFGDSQLSVDVRSLRLFLFAFMHSTYSPIAHSSHHYR
jgi:hypothetical protein